MQRDMRMYRRPDIMAKKVFSLSEVTTAFIRDIWADVADARAKRARKEILTKTRCA